MVLGEWWVHCRGIAPLQFEGHPYHWDHDEELRMQKGEWRHPRYSTVFYVEGDAGGGPTVVTDGRIKPDWRARAGKSIHAHMTSSDGRAWAVWPVSNRALVFDGSLLHGVLPAAAPTPSLGNRTTLMVGLYTTPCTPAAADRKDLVGCVRGDGLGFEEAFPLQPPEMLAAHAVATRARRRRSRARSARAARTEGRGRARRKAARARRSAARSSPKAARATACLTTSGNKCRGRSSLAA